MIASIIRPKTHWHGIISATDPTATGTKAAFEIKKMFRLADDTDEPIYIETTVPRAKLIYQAAGYEIYSTLKHPYDDLTTCFFHRSPFISSQKKQHETAIFLSRTNRIHRRISD